MHTSLAGSTLPCSWGGGTWSSLAAAQEERGTCLPSSTFSHSRVGDCTRLYHHCPLLAHRAAAVPRRNCGNTCGQYGWSEAADFLGEACAAKPLWGCSAHLPWLGGEVSCSGGVSSSSCCHATSMPPQTSCATVSVWENCVVPPAPSCHLKKTQSGPVPCGTSLSLDSLSFSLG